MPFLSAIGPALSRCCIELKGIVVMKRFIFSVCLPIAIISCGDQAEKNRSDRTKTIASEKQGGTVDDPTQSGPVIPAPAVTITPPPIYPVVQAVPASPDAFSRAIASTPHAVECIDAFVAQGYPEAAGIEYAVSRGAITKFGSSIAVGDYNQTQFQVLNVISVESCFASVDLRLFNPLGYYCIVFNNAFKSDITIQRNCASKLISLENNIVTKFGSNKSSYGNYSMFSSQDELPCIP
jgi:hypothetical protein